MIFPDRYEKNQELAIQQKERITKILAIVLAAISVFSIFLKILFF